MGACILKTSTSISGREREVYSLIIPTRQLPQCNKVISVRAKHRAIVYINMLPNSAN